MYTHAFGSQELLVPLELEVELELLELVLVLPVVLELLELVLLVVLPVVELELLELVLLVVEPELELVVLDVELELELVVPFPPVDPLFSVPPQEAPRAPSAAVRAVKRLAWSWKDLFMGSSPSIPRCPDGSESISTPPPNSRAAMDQCRPSARKRLRNPYEPAVPIELQVAEAEPGAQSTSRSYDQ
jgi:hypothetical protein